MSKARIMIVEDEALIAMELKDRLELQDYNVCGTMARGEDAVRGIVDLHPDLTLMDINLAGEMNGIEAAGKMRENGIPVIYLTAYSSPEMVRQAAHTEPYGFLVKPFNETELRATVETALYKHGMERKLRASEARLAEAQRIAHIGNWDWDVAKNELYWSDEIYRIFGVNPQEFGATYEAFLSFVHAEDRGYVDRSVQEAFKGKSSYNIEHRVVRPDGEMRYVHEQAQVFRDGGGNVVRMAGTVQDITKRKIAEEKSREASHLVQEILASVTDAFAAVDREARITYLNDHAVTLWRHAREDLLGKSLWVVFPEALGTPFYKEVMKAVENGELVHFEELYPPFNTWFEVDVYPSPEGASIFFRDVTARRLAQEERENLVQELTRALANVKTLSAMLPICSACKKIRDDKGYWSQIEEYVRKHTDTQFSHGICPDCVRTLYPEVADSVEARLKEVQEREGQEE
ncbi:MAG: PAS domain-containing protein [Acidobacteriia bacterium]|nr:PAS domain-containing protein [Terriglobia bacterium]